MDANDGFRRLDRRECLGLLATVPMGRIVYTRQALPAVLPVNFCLDLDVAVVVRTSESSELASAIDGAVVAFEADAAADAGWSVVVLGPATLVTDPAEHARLLRTGPRSWAPAPREVFARITLEMITGRELMGGRTLYGVDHSS
ncbi:pyridoxamine 5'-phosphate oxidase family protein [Streptomyces sp. NPDC059618]|uniref:pyridoxamine 5'-phosphate oxidase family protein n=1 Tax=Streptomyces sp. NPDC059618 TaxID=3346887 RepID=UPI003677842D